MINDAVGNNTEYKNKEIVVVYFTRPWTEDVGWRCKAMPGSNFGRDSKYPKIFVIPFSSGRQILDSNSN
jgi:hypothetical protein